MKHAAGQPDTVEATRQATTCLEHFGLQRRRERDLQRYALVLVRDRGGGTEHTAAIAAHGRAVATSTSRGPGVVRQQRVDIVAPEAELLQHAVEVDSGSGAAARVDDEQVVLERAAAIDSDQRVPRGRKIDDREGLDRRILFVEGQVARGQPRGRGWQDRHAASQRFAHQRSELAGDRDVRPAGQCGVGEQLA